MIVFVMNAPSLVESVGLALEGKEARGDHMSCGAWNAPVMTA